MVKAIIELKNGTKVSVEGTPEEVARTKELMIAKERNELIRRRIKRGQKRRGPLSLILELKVENFFDKPRTIGEVKQKLEEKTYYYPQSSLSPALIRLVKQGEFGRLKKDGKWVWVKR
jgi:hypothetical protein